MKKKIIIGIILGITCLPSLSETIDMVFMSIPTHLFPNLSKSSKLDLIDYARYEMFEQSIETNFEGELKIHEFSDSTMTLCLDSCYYWTLKQETNAKGDTIYTINKTIYCGTDTLTFKNSYNRDWTLAK
jgi:hypothetical protein